jgi:hypothetical protein
MFDIRSGLIGGGSTPSVRPFDHGETAMLARSDSKPDAGTVIAKARGGRPTMLAILARSDDQLSCVSPSTSMTGPERARRSGALMRSKPSSFAMLTMRSRSFMVANGQSSVFKFCIPTKATTVPDTPDWLHEVKYDGYRLRLERDGDRVRLITRGGYPACPECSQAAAPSISSADLFRPLRSRTPNAAC